MLYDNAMLIKMLRDKEITRLSTPQNVYVAAINKEGFGFIETMPHVLVIFFHFSNIEGNREKLQVRLVTFRLMYSL